MSPLIIKMVFLLIQKPADRSTENITLQGTCSMSGHLQHFVVVVLVQRPSGHVKKLHCMKSYWQLLLWFAYTVHVVYIAFLKALCKLLRDAMTLGVITNDKCLKLRVTNRNEFIIQSCNYMLYFFFVLSLCCYIQSMQYHGKLCWYLHQSIRLYLLKLTL